MHENQLWRAFSLFFLGLGLVNSRQVPNYRLPIVACRSQQIWLHLGETNVVDVASMAFQAEELGLDIPGVPYSHRPI